MLSAHIQTRAKANTGSADRQRELENALQEKKRLEEKIYRKEYEDRQKQGRDALIVAWIKAGVDAGLVDYKVAYESLKDKLLSTPLSSNFGTSRTQLSIEDGFIRVDNGKQPAYMHGGELESARDHLMRTGRMPVPLDEPHVMPNSKQFETRKQLAARYGISLREFDSQYAVLGSRPYSTGLEKTDYWLHSVADTTLFDAQRKQQLGFAESV